MKSMLKNSCKAAKIEIVKTTALQELDLISRVKLAAGGQPWTAAKCRKWKTWNTSKTRKKIMNIYFYWASGNIILLIQQ